MVIWTMTNWEIDRQNRQKKDQIIKNVVVIGCQHEGFWLTKKKNTKNCKLLGIKHGWLENNMLVGKSSSDITYRATGGLPKGNRVESGASMGPQSWSKFGTCYPLVMTNIAIENGDL